MRNRARFFVYLFFISIFLGLLPLPALAATRVVYSRGNLGNTLLLQILRDTFPNDTIKIVWTNQRLQSQPQLQPRQGYRFKLQSRFQEWYRFKLQPPPQPRPQVEPQSGAQPQPGLQGLTQDEQMMFNLVDQERARVGLAPLAVDYELVRLARLKSQDMVDKGYFGHYSPTYGSPFEMMDKAGVKYRYAGENIAGASTVEAAFRALMNSPGHRANILGSRFSRIGIGVIPGGPYGKTITQMFAG